jgi:hypothetical protein
MPEAHDDWNVTDPVVARELRRDAAAEWVRKTSTACSSSALPTFVWIGRRLPGFRPVDTAPQGGPVSSVEPDVLLDQFHELRMRPTDVVTDVEDRDSGEVLTPDVTLTGQARPSRVGDGQARLTVTGSRTGGQTAGRPV